MPKDKFILVSLEETKAKQLAEVITNPTSKRILNYLTEHEDATETKLSQELSIPLPTTHYNLQKLKEAGLIAVEEFHYSKKGREVDHYKLASKYIIIAPKETRGLKTKLRSILPVALSIAFISTIIHFTQKFYSAAKPAAMEAASILTVEEAQDMATKGIAMQAPSAQNITKAAQTVTAEPSLALWFLLGGLVALALYALITLIKKD